MPARVLMVQGTSSSVGKSLLTAALCRIFARRGFRVAPFKAQNMSNNAAVCADGSEIGRAQAVQAAAAGVDPTADMNPILLKPEAGSRCQVIVQGRPWRTLPAGSYYRSKEELWPRITAALERLRAGHDLVVIEGAGSPVELNLRAGDIVNMAVARHVQAPVLLAADIDRGGIFAQVLGTLWLLPPEERALVRGLLINKFRGDLALFADGVRLLEERGGCPVLGVIPYLPALAIPEEDMVALEAARPTAPVQPVDIAVLRLPHIANFDDFDPLAAEPEVRVRYVGTLASLGNPAAVILPGTKSTMADLAWLRAQGFEPALRQLADQGTAVVGICGGYQMLGRILRDPERIESATGEMPGLGLLPVETTFATEKATYQARARLKDGPGWLAGLAGQEVEGYEIHLGHTRSTRPFLEITSRNGRETSLADGNVSEDGRIWGCYLHGLFANAGFRRAWLDSLGRAGGVSPRRSVPPGAHAPGSPDNLHTSLELLANAVEAALDMEQLHKIMGASPGE